MHKFVISFVVLILLTSIHGQPAIQDGAIYQADFSAGGQSSAADYLREARDLLRRGNFPGAREAAQKALDGDAKSAEAEYLLGASALALGQLDAARSYFGEAIRLAPQYLEARRGLGAIYLIQKRYVEASIEFSRALEIKRDDFISLYSLGLSYLLQDRAQQSLEPFEHAYRINPNEVGLLAAILQANVKLKQRPPTEKTLAEISRLLDARDPRRLQIAFLLGTEGFYDLAIKEYEALRQTYPESTQLSFNLALAYHRLRRESEAANVLGAALTAHPDAGLFNLYGEIQEARHLPDQAVAAYQRSAEMEPQNEDYLFDYAQSLVGAGTPDEAIRVFTKATEIFPNSTRMRLGLGAAQYVKGNYERAVDIFLQASQQAPQAPEVYELLGRVYEAAGAQQETIERRFSEYLVKQKRDASAEFFYGKMLAAHARQEAAPAKLMEAQRHLERAVELNETFAEAHLELGNLLFEKEQFAAARTHLERAAALAPTSPNVFYRLSRLYSRIGERVRAQDAIRRFQELKANGQGDGGAQERNEMLKYLKGESR